MTLAIIEGGAPASAMARSAGNTAADIALRSTASMARPNADDTCSRLAIRLTSAVRLVPAAWNRAGLKNTASPLRHGALQAKHGRELVRVPRELRGLGVRGEPEVVVAMHALRRAARVDHVDLRGDLIARPEPGAACGRDEVVGVVGREHLRRAQGQLLQRVPDPVVLPGLGEVVACGAARRPLAGDDRLELPRGPVDDADVTERTGQHHDAGAVEQGAGQFGFHPRPAGRAG